MAKIFWDGLGFFSLDLKKVPTLRKKGIQWLDKFTDPIDSPIMAMSLFFALWIVVPVLLQWHYADEKAQDI